MWENSPNVYEIAVHPSSVQCRSLCSPFQSLEIARRCICFPVDPAWSKNFDLAIYFVLFYRRLFIFPFIPLHDLLRALNCVSLELHKTSSRRTAFRRYCTPLAGLYVLQMDHRYCYYCTHLLAL